MTDLDDEIYGMFDDDLCDLACRLIQYDAKVVLSGG
jgi:hypothetical protein